MTSRFTESDAKTRKNSDQRIEFVEAHTYISYTTSLRLKVMHETPWGGA